MLLPLAIALAFFGYRVLRKQSGRQLLGAILLASGVSLGSISSLHIQDAIAAIMIELNQPEGGTVDIPASDATYTNTSGVALQIGSVTPPPSCATTAPVDECVTDLVLNNGESCSTVYECTQTISFTSTPPTDATVGGATYQVTATATSGLAVTFSTTSAACSVSGSTVTFGVVGECVINADQAGDADFSAAPQQQQSFSVASGSTLTAVAPAFGPASGGTGITLTGTGLTGATAVTFDGVAASSVNVVDSTTVTAVTPAHPAGAVDIVITTPAGEATLTNGFTFLATAVGQPSGGGTIACLNGGFDNLIAATADNSTGIEWGGFGTATGVAAQSPTDGATNTAATVGTLGNNGGTPYGAQLCNGFEVDSQSNTPCQAGNACYDDWFLPAQNQLLCLFENRVAIGGFAANAYWSSTELSANPSISALGTDFSVGTALDLSKSSGHRVRCLRAFTP